MAISKGTKAEFVRQIVGELKIGDLKNRHNKTSLEKKARVLGISDPNLVKELIELAIVQLARKITHDPKLNVDQRYWETVSLYQGQVNLSQRTSKSIMLQQYSTPAPIAYLAGVFAGIDRLGGGYFEPSAGNGMLTIAGHPDDFWVNEIDEDRRANLATQGFFQVWNKDASTSFGKKFNKEFDALITNPPFGTLGESIQYDTIRIRTLDHLMTLNALETMADHGRAAIIIGGHTSWDELGRIQRGKNRIFFNYLYKHYKVLDVIMIDGKKLYSRMGTSFNVRLILIDGRKDKAEGFAPLKSQGDVIVHDFSTLQKRIMENIDEEVRKLENDSFQLADDLEDLRLDFGPGLGGPYLPTAQSCFSFDVMVPDSMDAELHSAMAIIRRDIEMPVEEYVKDRLGYDSHTSLCKALAAEQIDAVAMAIYNIEFRRQGVIIGDQTGIGKGRVAAAMIRYGIQRGLKPIFLSEKPNLFSDLYRDLLAIGSQQYVPFIINTRDAKSSVKDESGELIHQALTKSKQDSIIASEKLPEKYDFIMATYTQFNSEKRVLKKNFLLTMASKNIMVMDEAHNASGSSQTGVFMQQVVGATLGVTFLSATYAKRPDNMPLYAMKTAMSDANLSPEGLTKAILKGGVALQELLSSQLVSEGQMMRRERSNEGIEVNYINLDYSAAKYGLENQEQEHKAIADSITGMMRGIIDFQKGHINPFIKRLDEEAARDGKEITKTEGTNKAGVDNKPYFSKVFNVINQMLMAIKAESTAKLAIKRLKEGKKPVIAFSSTLGSFIDDLETPDGEKAMVGDLVRADFSSVLIRGLESVRKITTIDSEGDKKGSVITLPDLGIEASKAFNELDRKMRSLSSGISISPIDYVKQLIQAEGYKVAEVTGRSHEIIFDLNTFPAYSLNGLGKVVSPNGLLRDTTQLIGTLRRRKKIPTNDAFRMFNDNEVDVLMINQSGSTGASAHAIPTQKVPEQFVKPRVMIILQPELNINTEVQKRGRINRTGQIHKPSYDYVISAIPAEKRLMMMLQKKLKSLDANTSSNQKQSESLLKIEDFLNKYGDEVVEDYLKENLSMNDMLDNPLGIEDGNENKKPYPKRDRSMSEFVSGRVAVLPTQMQEKFYREVSQRYNEHIEYLKQTGRYDLELEVMDLQAKTLQRWLSVIGVTNDSIFGDDTVLERVEVKNLSKPFSGTEVKIMLEESLQGKKGKEISTGLLQECKGYILEKGKLALLGIDQKFQKEFEGVKQTKSFQKFVAKHEDKSPDLIISHFEEVRATIKKEWDGKRKKTELKYNSWFTHIGGILRFFYPGKAIQLPIDSTSVSPIYESGIFLGFLIDRTRDNPWAASAIKLRFALASSTKYLAVPASGESNKIIVGIKGASLEIPATEDESLLKNWDKRSVGSTGDWQERFIVSGNILQGIGKYSGKLISFTTRDGKARKGILLNKHWSPDPNTLGEVDVPIIKALPIIRKLPRHKLTITNGGVGFVNNGFDFYSLYVPASKTRGGKYFLDQEILALVQDNNFRKVSAQMVAKLPAQKLDDLVRILQEKFKDSITLSNSEFMRIKTDFPKRKIRALIPPSQSQKTKDTDLILILELEAEALELDLLNLNL